MKEDPLFSNEIHAVQRRPDRWVMSQEVRRLLYAERLAFRVDPASKAAVKANFLRCVGQDDAPIRRLDDIAPFAEGVGEVEHVGIHCRLDPIIWFDDC